MAQKTKRHLYEMSFLFSRLQKFEPRLIKKSSALQLSYEVGSSARLPLPVADEGRRAESPRSNLMGVPLVGAPFKSGTASVIDVLFLFL